MKRGTKIIIGLLGTFSFMILAVVVVSYYIIINPIPDYEGSEKVNGISSEVKIYRDSLAVPYIIADTDRDAAFALGYVHAQERMFQMDLTRRAGEGRLSEILGSKTVPFDKMFKTIGIYDVVKNSYPKLNSVSQKLLDSYSKGVNAYLLTNKGNYSIEFDVLGYSPEKWKPEHSLVVAKLMAWELNISWWVDIAFSHLVQKFGAEKAYEILPGYEENAPVIIPEHLEYTGAISRNIINVDKKFRKFMGMEGTHLGSNNWVVNSNKSKSGKPIIANDPHLAFSIPGKWLVAVIKSKNWKTEGFTLPGLPGVVIGKNENISWVLTNVMTDDADFYVEQLDSMKTKYLLDKNWKDLEIVKDTIEVKDSTNIFFNIRKTHRGPIISEIHPYKILFPDSARPKATISMRWSALDFSDEVYAIYSVNNAGNWNEFTESLRHFTAPGQNFVYADKENNIGYVCAAKLPLRAKQSPTLVYDGTTSNYDWNGFVPYSKMPKLYNPSKNYIASANNKIIKSFPYHISNIWEPSSRIERIIDLLTSKDKHDVNDFKKYQLDIYSNYAKKITPYIVGAFESTNITDNNLKSSLDILNEWDFIMDKYYQAPTIFLVFFQNLLRNIFIDEMGEALFNEYVFIANVPYRIIQQMLKNNSSSWFDNNTTDIIEERDDIIRKSLSDALAELEEKFGKNIAGWQWKNLHSLTFKHPFSGISPLVDNLVNVGPFSLGGDGTTIFNSEYSFTNPYNNKLGPSMRYIFDFSQNDEFEFILPTGQSGHIMSEHYDDMTNRWLEGKYFRVNTNKLLIENSQMSMLKLIPL